MDKNPYEPPLETPQNEGAAPVNEPGAMLRHEYVTVGCLAFVVLLLLVVFVPMFVLSVAPI